MYSTSAQWLPVILAAQHISTSISLHNSVSVEKFKCNQKKKKVEIGFGTCVTYAGQEGLYYFGGCPYIPTRNNTNRMFRALAGLLIIGVATGELVNYILRSIFTAYSPSLIFSAVCVVSSFIISYLRPCKLTIANISLSYNSMVLGILNIALLLWNQDLSIGTTPLIWTFIIAPMISHVLVLMWVGYTLTHRIMSHFKYISSIAK